MAEKHAVTGRPRLTDVAAHAGVSITTASLILNNAPGARLSDETRSRVFEAARELNYRVNITARGLAIRRTHTLGFVGDEIATTEFAGGLIAGSQKEASANGMQLFVMETAGVPESERASIEALIDRDVEGVVFGVMSARAVEPPAILANIPTVLMNCFTEDNRFASVVADEEFGGYQAAITLLDAGHSRIGLVNGRREGRGAWASSQRLLGYRRALAERGIAFDEDLVVHGNWQPDTGYELTMQLLSRDDAPTALFCANDRMALGAYEAARELGLSVPADLSVVGYDNQPLSAYLFPPLTTVDLPHEEIGRVACALLQKLIAEGSPASPGRSLVRGEVVHRSSVAPPRA